MEHPSHIPQDPTDIDQEEPIEVDPEVREVAEQLPGYQEYIKEIQSERGSLTFGDW